MTCNCYCSLADFCVTETHMCGVRIAAEIVCTIYIYIYVLVYIYLYV